MPFTRLSRPLVIVALCGLAGCARNNRIAKVNDELREKNLELQGQVDQLKLRTQELEAQLRNVAASQPSVPSEILENTPHVAAISIGRLSFARDTNDDGQPDTLYLFVQPQDGMGRFTQLIGALIANAVILPHGGEARTVGHKTLSPREVRDAYRATVTAIHYVIEVPIELPDDAASDHSTLPADCTVQVRFEDGYSGQSYVAERKIRLGQ
jgi:hypothetical protein